MNAITTSGTATTAKMSHGNTQRTLQIDVSPTATAAAVRDCTP